LGKIDFWRGSKSSLAPNVQASPNAVEALLLMESFEESHQGWFWSTDHAGRLTYLSTGIQAAFGEGRDLLGARFADFFVPAEDETTARGKLAFLLAKQCAFEKVTVRVISGDERCWSVSGRPQFDSAGRFTGFRGSGLDITEQRKSSHHAFQLAKYDALTGLPNRLSMSASLAEALSGDPTPSCTVMLIDLDRFKQVNDTLGHPAGDVLLKQVGERLLRIVGDREKVFRLGGDEFQILCTSTDRGVVGSIATEVIASLSQPYSINGQRCIIGASIGIASAPADGASAEELIRNADLALYASKMGGRGRFRFFTGELLTAAEDKRLLEDDLRDALAKGQIYLQYQPIVESESNSVKGVEALMRWRHPERGEISPALFIPIAEDADLIGPLGEWALREACADAAKWPANLRVAVNVSPLQFANESFPDVVRSALAASGLSPGQLELEITEGVFLAESDETDTMFSRLKEIGVRLALDDFGTGYSSLSYLRTAPFDKIKIDQTFVRAATLPGSRNGAIIAAIVALAGALGMETTAEGIEFMDQLHLIRGLGVSHVQGYVYSKPISADEVRERIELGDWQIEPSGPAKQRSERQAIYRKVGLIHGSVYEPVLVRNLSESGALLEGVIGARKGDLCIVDFGDGQLAFARVTRASGRQQGIAFEQALVNDGNGGLCTPHRVSPYLLATMGVPSVDKSDQPTEVASDLLPVEALGERLGLKLNAPKSAPETPVVSKIPPVTTAGGEKADHSRNDRRYEREGQRLTGAEARRLIDAARVSQNRHLKYIVSLLMLTGARPGELLRARWSDIDIEKALWHIPVSAGATARELTLSQMALNLLSTLPRWDECAHVIANPKTRKPYRSLERSWEAVRVKAGLPFTELDDLRYCDVNSIFGSSEMLENVPIAPSVSTVPRLAHSAGAGPAEATFFPPRWLVENPDAGLPAASPPECDPRAIDEEIAGRPRALPVNMARAVMGLR
jgi:diguanylate cyclase (GGDEF)-like protein/PAS domain S-box-containing protein